MDKEMLRALIADGEKLRQLTGEDHGPYCWVEFECEECGAVEELDVLFNPNLTEFHCTGCGGVMVRMDG
jgi:ribosomal protein S27E